jgi:hypothetical protein
MLRKTVPVDFVGRQRDGKGPPSRETRQSAFSLRVREVLWQSFWLRGCNPYSSKDLAASYKCDLRDAIVEYQAACRSKRI